MGGTALQAELLIEAAEPIYDAASRERFAPLRLDDIAFVFRSPLQWQQGRTQTRMYRNEAP